MSLSSPTLTDITPIANNLASNGNMGNKPILIPNGGPSTMVPCNPEMLLANGVANGHITPVQESPFIGYIIAMHRKMVRTLYKRSVLY
uniref:ubiquitin carboxyl-terminal hydrolase 6-like n=1 Tax=Epinephelus lanceolatus TaxID=310571 RepID=UPI0014480B9A